MILKLENQGTESAAVVVDRLMYPGLFQPLDLPDTLDSNNILTVIESIFPSDSEFYSYRLTGLQRCEKIQRRVAELESIIERHQSQIKRQQSIIEQQHSRIGRQRGMIARLKGDY